MSTSSQTPHTSTTTNTTGTTTNDPLSKPYERTDLPQQQHPSSITNQVTDMSNLPEEFQYHPAPYHMSHEELDQVTHHHQIDEVRPHHSATTTSTFDQDSHINTRTESTNPETHPQD